MLQNTGQDKEYPQYSITSKYITMHLLLLFLTTLIAGIPLSAQILIIGVNIVDVEQKKIIKSQNVLVEKGLITAIGAKIGAPAGTRRINGKGKYLIPGFVDTHVHFFQSGGIYTRPDVYDLRKFSPYSEEIAWTHNNMENQLRRYTSAGITTVVDVGSTINFLKQRDTFRNKLYAPAIYMTGPLLVTRKSPAFKDLNEDDDPFYELNSIEDARLFIQKQLPFKPDFIKIGYVLPGLNKDSVARSYFPLVKAAIEEAHKVGLRVTVHAVQALAAELAVETGANHLAHTPLDEIVTSEFMQLVKEKNVVISSSLTAFEGYYSTFGQWYRLSEKDKKYAHPKPLQSILELKNLPDTALIESFRRQVVTGIPVIKRQDSMLKMNLKKMIDEGITVATATDAGNIGSQHVASYFRELAAMQNSGINMWQLLQSATINGARAVGSQEFGSIKIGKRADMVLLSKNPLSGLENWETVEWVFVRGHAWKPADLLKPFANAKNTNKSLGF